MTDRPAPSPYADASYDRRWFLLVPALWLLLFVAPAIWGFGPFHGALNSTDDYMRAVQVLDFLNDKGNSSFLQERLGPEGAPSPMHWTRIVDLPLAGFVGFFSLFTGIESAVLLTATLVPAAQLAILFLLAWWYTRPLAGPRRAFVAIVATALLWPTLRQFLIGGLDHHAWQILLTLGAFGCVVRAALNRDRSDYAVAAGLFFGLGLSIGAEILPWVAMAGLLQAWLWLVYGNSHLKNGLSLGLALAATTVLMFFLFRSPFEGFRPACDSLSPVFLTFAGALPAFWIPVAALSRFTGTVRRRLLAGAAVGLIVLCALALLVPDCLRDPYAISDPRVRDIWLSQVTEAKPFLTFARENPAFSAFSALPLLLGIAGCLWAFVREPGRRVLWAGMTGITVLSASLTFVQARFGDFAGVLALAPAAWFLASAGLAIHGRLGTRYARLPATARIGLSFVFFLACLGLFVARFTAGESVVAPGQADKTTVSECSMRGVARVLNQHPPGTVAAFIDYGPEILFRTHHRVLSAPYHNNVAGIRAAFDILSAADDESALQSIRASGADYILVCPRWAGYWETFAPEGGRPFALRLLQGDAPFWLSPVEVPGDPARLYRVLLPGN